MIPTSLVAHRKPLHVLLPTLGSAGDVHPVIALGLALRARGHRATILTCPLFQPMIESLGVEFMPVGTLEAAHALLEHQHLFHPRKGFELIAQHMIVPAIAEIYRLIERHADSSTVVASSGLSLGARVAQDKLGIPTATVHLQPSMIRSFVDGGMAGNVRISVSQPMWFKRAFFRLADWAVIDRKLKGPLNEFRAQIGLTPVKRVFHQWVHSPQCVIGFFPEWFAQQQVDWPPHTHLVGFPLWDGGGGYVPVPQEVEEFLNAGEAPIVVTPGSAGSTMDRYFLESVEAVRQLGVRAMLVTNFPQQLPRDLPPGVQAFGYLPFSELLPRAAIIVYHGGIGTLAQTIKAGIPHLVVPNGFDQFDSGWRIEQLGIGLSISQAHYRARRAAEAIRRILSDDALKQRARGYSARIESAAALMRACELIEGLSACR
jgi:rhamnosyltransferase subunit B